MRAGGRWEVSANRLMSLTTMNVVQRRVARVLRPGGPEVIEVGVEDVPALRDGEVLVGVEAGPSKT
jgi:hypothetical protein